MSDGVGDFHSQQAHVADRGRFARGSTDPAEQTLGPEKILFRHSLRQRAKERTVAAAQIDMQRRIASEKFFEIKLFDRRA